MSAFLPERFGPYVVLGKLGSGGMGAVYRAMDPRLQREVAVKVLHRNLDVSGAHERFLREARTVSSLNHPNICTVFDIGEQDGDPYLVMELLHGESLKDRIGKGPVGEEDLREIAFRCALALQAAHAKGVVHRDIKPANIFLVSDGQGAADVKVLDFGLAKLEADVTRAGHTQGLTRAGATVGTVEYMSPEQACGEVLDARSDLFSLGAVMYEMATGQIPFRGATSAIVFSELLNREPVPPREANLNLPPDLDRTIQCLLVKKRDQRLPSATALLEALAGGDEPSLPMKSVPEKPEPKPAVQTEPTAASLAPSGATRPIPTRPVETGRSETRSAERRTVEPSRQDVHPAPRSAEVVRAMPSQRSRETSVAASSRVNQNFADPAPANRQRRTGELPQPSSRVHVHVESVPEAERVAPQKGGGGSRVWIALAVAFLIAGGSAAWYFLHGSGAATLSGAAAVHGPLQMMPLLNQTGNATLDHAPTELLELLLDESPSLAVRRPAPVDVLEGGSDGTEAQARTSGGAGDLSVLSGFLSKTNDGYLVHLTVKRAGDGTEIATVEDTANSLPEVPEQIAQLAGRVRMALGESSSSVSENGATVADDGSENFVALAQVAAGDAHAEMGDDPAALSSYQRAVDEAPKFVQARMRIASLLLRMHADTEAAAALDSLAAQPPAGGPHLRAEREYLLARRGGSADALGAAERWYTGRPEDEDASAAWVEELLRAGRAKDAVDVAQKAVTADPFRLRNQQMLTRAEIANGHADAAWTTQTRAFNAGLGSPGLSLAAAVLMSDAGHINSALNQVHQAKAAPGLILDEAVYAANLGDLHGSTELLDRAATLAASVPGAASTGAYILALKRWNAALNGQCGSPAPAGNAAGDTATLLWVTAAWCNVQAPQAQPISVEAKAAQQWLTGDKGEALTSLANGHAGHSVISSLMRARLELLAGKPDASISDLKAVANRRGAAYLTGSIAYPVALAMLANTYRSTGDQANAQAEESALHAVWGSGPVVGALLRSTAVHWGEDARAERR